MGIYLCAILLATGMVMYLFNTILNARTIKKMDTLWQINARTLQKINKLIDMLESDNEYQE